MKILTVLGSPRKKGNTANNPNLLLLRVKANYDESITSITHKEPIQLISDGGWSDFGLVAQKEKG